MKVCKYCGTTNKDTAEACSSCGAKAFSHKCSNCGTVYDEGNFCPNCGVKAGAKPKKCPNCGREYYTNACPDCGYIKNGNGYGQGVAEPVKKRRTWLWVLGWIFIFPVPLTIIMVNRKDIHLAVRILSVVAAWGAYLYFYAVGSAEAAVAAAGLMHCL